jgi:hypothetical protein
MLIYTILARTVATASTKQTPRDKRTDATRRVIYGPRHFYAGYRIIVFTV